MFNLEIDDLMIESFEKWLLTEEEENFGSIALVQCLKPKQNPKQLFAVQTRDKDVIVRLCNFTNKTPKIIRMGDKTAHVVLCEMNKSGRIVQLKNGLGDNPIAVMSSAFDVVMETARKAQLDAVMFRFNVSRMKGKTELVKRVIERLVRRTPKFEVFQQEVMTSKKIALVVVKRRGMAIDKIKGIKLDESLFTKVESDLGDRWVSKATGESLTKDEAYAASLVSEEERNAEAEQRVAAKSRLTKEEMLKTQATYNSDYVNHPEKINLKPEEDITEAEPKKQFNTLIDRQALERSTARSLNDWTSDIITRYGFMRTIFESEADAKYAVSELVKVQDQYDPLSAEVIAASVKRLKEIMSEEVFENKITALAMDRVDQSMPADVKAEMLRSHITQIKTDALRNVASGMFEAIASNMGEMMADIDLDLPGAEGFVLSEYADAAYINMNNFLTDRKLEEFEGIADPEELVKMCDALDNAFSNYGVKLDPGTILYRGMDFRSQMWETARKQKAFYFKNYVSTSLAPNIFGGWNANVASAVAGVDSMAGSRGEGGANVAFSIAGAENIPVLPVGNKAFAYKECEILLPRGVVLSFDTVTRATASTDSQETYYIEAHIMNKNELAALQESGEMIADGDAFIREGVIKPASDLSFSSFITEAKTERKKADKATLRQLIADLVSVDAMPDKFKM